MLLNNQYSSNIFESFVKDYLGNPIVYYTSSDSEAKQMISTLLTKNPVRGLYDLKNKIYIFGDAYNIIHAELIEKMRMYGRTNFQYPIIDEEIYNYIDKNCAMFKIIDENDYKSFRRSDGYRYAYIGKLDNNQYIIFRNNELVPEYYNAPDEFKKIQQVPLFKNIKFKKYDIRGTFLNTKDQLPQRIVDESYKPKILNEVFSFDSLSKKQLELLAQKVIDNMEENYDILNNEDFETYVEPLNLPESVLDMIATDWKTSKENLTVPEILGSPYSKKYLIKEIIEEFKNDYNFIESFGNPLILYRYLNLYYEKSDYIDNKLLGDTMLQHILSKPNIHLGLSWTPYFSKAEDFGDINHDLNDGIIMEIKVSRDAINLPNTLILRNYYTYYNYENEIELIKGSPVLLTKIYKLDDNGNWKQKIINKQYKT